MQASTPSANPEGPASFDLASQTPGGFSVVRLQTLVRLAAYVLILEFSLNLLFTLIPFGVDANRMFAQLSAALSTTSLPVLALPLLFAGCAAGARTGRWERWITRRFKPLILLTALLYLLAVPGLWWFGAKIQAAGDAQIQQEIKTTLAQFNAYKTALEKTTDTESLRRLVQAQPQLRQSLDSTESPFASSNVSLAQQQAQASRLVERISANIHADGLQRRSRAAGELRKQQLRLSLLALGYALFFLLAGLIWPSLRADVRTAA